MIELLGVSKSYSGGAKKAVDNLSLTVRPGEVFGFLGPNGAGKTTTILFLNTISAVPSSAISREGRWFWVSQSIPVPPRILVQAKLLHSLLFALLNLVVVTGVMFWLRLATPFNISVVLVGGLLVSIVTGYSGLLIDVIRPNLTWTDPQQAMKGNINSLFALLATLVLGFISRGTAALLHAFARPVFLPGVLALLALEGWVLGKVTGALAERRFLEYAH